MQAAMHEPGNNGRIRDSDERHAMPHVFDRRRALAGLGAISFAPLSLAPLSLSTMTAGCATQTPSALAPAFAPTGKLRACINLGNAVLAKRGADGQPAGVSVDLARAFAGQLGVDVEYVVVDAAMKSVEAVRGGKADIGFFAIDPTRGEGIRFTAPYVLIEGAYLVRRESPLTANDQVDRAGTRVMVATGSAYDLFLTRNLKSAELLRTARSQEVVDAFLAQKADVAAAVKQQLQADVARLGDRVRLLPGRFMVIEQAMGLPAERGEGAAQVLSAFVEIAKATGLVEESLRRHGIQGATVAPPAQG